MIQEYRKLEKFLKNVSRDRPTLGQRMKDVVGGDEQLAKEICHQMIDKPMGQLSPQLAHSYLSGFIQALNIVFYFRGMKEIDELEELYNRKY